MTGPGECGASETDLDELKGAIDEAVRRSYAVGGEMSAKQPARALAVVLADLDPGLAILEGVRMVEDDPAEALVREVMEEPQDEMHSEMIMRVAMPLRYIHVDFLVKK
jgi:CO/xanthine dehydrogenase FAD-binding subunit